MAEYIRAVSLFTGSLLEVWAIRSSSFKTTIQEHSHETQHCTGNACDLFRRGDLGSSGPSCLSPIFPWRAHLHYLEAPGAGTSEGQGTVPFSINTAGAIAGMYYDANNAYHGFVRAATGTITTFEAPGAGTGAAQGTVSFSINTAGDIAGTYVDARYVYHGFARAANGKITAFKAPGAGAGAHQGTVPISINTTGVIAGTYLDSSNVYHGFVRAPMRDSHLQGSRCRYGQESGNRRGQHERGGGYRRPVP